MRNKLFIPVAALILFISSCATSIPVEMTDPPKLNYNNAKIVGILPFGTSEFDVQSSMREEGLWFFWNFFSNSDLKEELRLARYLTSEFENLVVSSNFFKVIPSSQLKNQLDDDSVTADAFISASINSPEESYEEEEVEKFDEDGVQYFETLYIRSTEITVYFQILDGKDYSILDTHYAKATASDSSYDWQDLKSFEELNRDALDSIVRKVEEEFVPTTYTSYRTMLKLNNDKDPRIERIDTFINNKFYDEALDLYMDIYAETGDAKAKYNAILLQEIVGDVEGALQEMTDLATDTGLSEAFIAVKRMENDIQTREALER